MKQHTAAAAVLRKIIRTSDLPFAQLAADIARGAKADEAAETGGERVC